MEKIHIINNRNDHLINKDGDTHILYETFIADCSSYDSQLDEEDMITEEAKRFVQSYEGRRSLFEQPLPDIVHKDFLTPIKLLLFFVLFITLFCFLSLFI